MAEHSMNESTAPVPGMGAARAPQSRLATGFLVVIVLAIGINAWKLFEEKSIIRSMLVAVKHPERFPLPQDQSDKIFLEGTGSENILLKFSGFEPSDLAITVYFRSVYLLFPRRVYVAQPGTVINLGPQILSAPWSPSPEWLDEHRVACVLEYVREENGRVRHEKSLRNIQ